MQVPPGGKIVLVFKDALAPPSGTSITLDFTDHSTQPTGAGGFDASVFGPSSVIQHQMIKPVGWQDSKFPSWPLKTPTIARYALRIYPLGWDASVVQSPQYVRWRRYVQPPSLFTRDNIPSPISIRLAGGYQPAPGSNLILNFSESLVPPPGSVVVLEFGAEGSSRILGVTVGQSSQFGAHEIGAPVQLRPSSLGDQSVFGSPVVQGSVRTVSLNTGIAPPPFGNATIAKSAVAILTAGFNASTFGVTRIYNLRQYVRATGYLSDLFGFAYASGGVKTVFPSGYVTTSFGVTVAINTTADRTVAPAGISSPPLGAVTLSPRTIFASGFVGAIGSPLIQRSPHPLGFDSLRISNPVVEYKTKVVSPASVALVEPYGYPRVFDPTQKVYPPSLLQGAIFGDTRIRNITQRLSLFGFDELAVSPWATIQSNRRSLLAAGFSASTFGLPATYNNTLSLSPNGFDSLRMGAEAEYGIGFLNRQVGPAGIYRTVFGTPVVTKTPQLNPSGFTGSYGVPTVWLGVRTSFAAGHDSQTFGDTTVWFSYRTVGAEGFDGALHSNQARIEHGRRTILGLGANNGAVGAARIGNKNRTVSPPSIFDVFATGHIVGGTRHIQPVGFVASLFGTRIIPEVQNAYPMGFSGVFGLASLQNWTRHLRPASITTTPQPTDSWGKPRAWNLRQYISVDYYHESGLNPPAWPQWTLIANRNRVIGAIGFRASRHGDQQIDNNARPLLPAGIAAPSWPVGYKAGMVAERIRTLRLDGLEAPYISSWAIVFNDARVISGAGSDLSRFGTAAVANTRRYFDRIGGFDVSCYGYPMVADRIRSVGFEGRYTIGAPSIPLPEVKLYTRYIDAIGFESFGVGNASLSIHFTLITPRWTMQNLYGIPSVRNNTPELYTKGRASDEFGGASVRLEWRPVNPLSDSTMQVFGRSEIAFRDRALFMSGIRSWAIGGNTKVTKTGSPPYSTQFISLDGDYENEDRNGSGIPIPEDQVSRAVINQQVLYPAGEVMSRYGGARVTANSIRVEPGYGELLVGDPMVALSIRTLSVEGIGSISTPSKVRLTPHTIWAVVDAPDQAKINHPTEGGLQYIRSMAEFGRPTITLRHRSVPIPGAQHTRMGIANVFNKRSHVSVNGISSLRFGWHSLPADVVVEQFDSSDTMSIGSPSVGRPPYLGPRTVRPAGYAATLWGANRIELFNRNVYPVGMLASSMGASKPNDNPYMWQGLRVGPPVPFTVGGYDMSSFGEPWISFRVRELLVSGFDSFRCEYDLRAFDQRMRVTRAAWSGGGTPPPREIAPVGFASFNLAVPNVRPAVHYIRPDGNSDQFRKGAF